MTDNVIDAGVLVRLRPLRYWQDPKTNVVYVGATRTQPPSAPFRISAARWARDQGLNGHDRMFEKVDE